MIELTQPMEQYKREHWCAQLRIPESGNHELDAMIRTALRKDLAAMAMQGMVADWGESAYKPASVAAHAVAHADALLAALATPPEGGEV